MGGAPTYKFTGFSQKLHEIKKILVPGRGRAGGTPLDPPLTSSSSERLVVDPGFSRWRTPTYYFANLFFDKNAFQYDAVAISGGGVSARWRCLSVGCQPGGICVRGVCPGRMGGVGVSAQRGCLLRGCLPRRVSAWGSLHLPLGQNDRCL